MAQDFLEHCQPYLETHASALGQRILRRRAIVLSFLDSNYNFQKTQVPECVAQIRRETGKDVSESLVQMDAGCYRNAFRFLNLTDRGERSEYLAIARRPNRPEFRIVKILGNAKIFTWEDLEKHCGETQPQAEQLPLEEQPPTTEPVFLRIPKEDVERLETRVGSLLQKYFAQVRQIEGLTSENENLKYEIEILNKSAQELRSKIDRLESTAGITRDALLITDEFPDFVELSKVTQSDKSPS